jgi:glycosyltransferase involved in cell wall biosynthesis
VISQTDQPTVDVIIPCFNHGRFLADAVDSALRQTYPRVNVTVVDDGSTDDTPIVAGKFGSRIQYIRKANGGQADARNTGIRATSGDFLVFLDSDDLLHNDSLRRHIEVANRQPDASVIYGDYRYVDEGGQEIGRDDPIDFGDDAFHALLAGLVPPIHALTIQRSVIVNAGCFDTSIRWHEDLEMWLRIAAAGHRFAKADFLGAFYRKHVGTWTQQTLEMAQWGLIVLRRTKQYHPQCPVCMELLPLMVSKWNRCYAAAIRAELMTIRPDGHRGRHVVKGLRHLLYNPSLTRYLLADLGRRIRDRTLSAT